jgi:hypothetical protein
MSKKVYVIDGNRFSNLEGFFQEVASVLTPGRVPCKGLDCFNDILWGGYGTPDKGFVLIWKNSDLSRIALGYEQTIALRQVELTNIIDGLTYNEVLEREYARIQRSHPDRDDAYHLRVLESFKNAFRAMEHELALARQHKGDTLFDLVVEIIRVHPKIGLRLE